MLHIVNDILDISKIEAGMLQIDETPFQLNEVINNVISTLKLKASEKNIKLLYAIDSDVTNNLLGDKNRLNQILINIVGNAIKFTEKGKIELRVANQKTENNTIFIEFSIIDTGIGINQKKLQSIFDRFSQAEVSTSRKFGGTGLGLSISKELIDMQKGSISVQSTENVGTTFTFVIPYTINLSTTHFLDDKKEVELFASFSKNILLCEDNELNQKLITTIFEKTNHKIYIANNGVEALELLKNKDFDIILMDLQMPKMDGYETTTIIRNELHLTIPIIALTANSLIYEKERCMNMGMNDYLSKPFSKKDLFELLNKYFYSEKDDSKVQKLVSLDHLKEFVGDNNEQILLMIDSFETQLAQFLLMLNTNFIDKNYESIKKNAHKLKTSFGMFGISTKELETIEFTKDEEFELYSEAIIQPLKEYINQILAELNTIKNEIGTYRR